MGQRLPIGLVNEHVEMKNAGGTERSRPRDGASFRLETTLGAAVGGRFENRFRCWSKRAPRVAALPGGGPAG